MISTFNLTELSSTLEYFYTLTQIRVSVYDEAFHYLTSYPQQLPRCCHIIRTDREADVKCIQCDRHAFVKASRMQSPYVYRCHAGFTECVVPLYLGNILVGYLMFGNVFSYDSYEEGWAAIESLCSSYQLDLDELKEACLENPIITSAYTEAASQILIAIASYLCMKHMSAISREKLPIQIDEFITEHFTENIDVKVLCDHFQITKYRLYEIAHQCYGKGIAEHIRTLRINKAKDLLLAHPQLHITDVSSMCGFEDYNYFITVFKRETGSSPKTYRASHLSELT